MTGLDIDTCHIMEVACLITDAKLQVVSDDFDVIINQPDNVLDKMSEWCVKQHGKVCCTILAHGILILKFFCYKPIFLVLSIERTHRILSRQQSILGSSRARVTTIREALRT